MWSLTSNVTPTTTLYSDSSPRDTYDMIFSASLPPFLHFHEACGTLPPMSPLRQQHIRIPLLALPTSRFFPASLPQFLHFHESCGVYLQRHPNGNTIFGFPSSRYLIQDFFPPLYLNFYIFMKRWPAVPAIPQHGITCS